MTYEQLNTALRDIQESLDADIEISSPLTIMEKIQSLTQLIGLSAECYAWSEKHYNEKLGELVLRKEYNHLSFNEKKLLFASLASKEIHIHSWAERLNKGITHDLEGLRSLLSYLKEEYRQNEKQ